MKLGPPDMFGLELHILETGTVLVETIWKPKLKLIFQMTIG